MSTDLTESDVGDEGSILLEYADLNGISRGMLLDKSEWNQAVEEGVGFGSIIMDWYESHNARGVLDPPTLGPSRGEIQAVADPESRVPVPWASNGLTKANCSLLHRGEPFDMCSRRMLERVLERYADRNTDVNVGTEIEFNLFEEWDEDQLKREGPAYLAEAAAGGGSPYHTRPLVERSDYFDALAKTMKQMGGTVEGIHKESSPGLYEAILKYSPALRQADAIMSFRMASLALGDQYDLRPTFMPRPLSDYEGNSQHYHVSLWDDEGNRFENTSDERGISAEAYQFIAGVLEHARPLTALCASTVNSYKRLKPGLWAPIDISYGFDNKTCPIRIPHGRGTATRVEIRIPDSFANPYLALAGILAAGLDGIENNRSPGEPVSKNIFEEGADPDNQLPTSLTEALAELEDDDYLQQSLSERGIDQYCELKRNEAERYDSKITDWEVREYIGRF